MPEKTFGPEKTTLGVNNASSDADYIFFFDAIGGTSINFGRDGAKSPGNRGTVQTYDLRTVALGATVVKANLEWKPAISDSGAFAVDVEVFASHDHLNPSEHLSFDSLWNYFPDHNTFPTETMWDDGTVSGGDSNVTFTHNLEDGVGRFGQVWTVDTPGNGLVVHYWRGWRAGTAAPAKFNTAIYEVVGEPGDYYKGALIDRGVERDLTEVPTSEGAFFNLPVTNPLVLTQDRLYYSELSVYGGAGTGRLLLVNDRNHANGGTTNCVLEAALDAENDPRVIYGFRDNTCWHESIDLVDDVPIQGTTDTVSVVPNTSNGVNQVWGDSAYGGNDVDLTNFTANIQAALDSRRGLGDRVCILFRRDASWAVNDRERVYHCSRSSTETISGVDGMVLRIDYTEPPGTRHQRRKRRSRSC